MKVIINRCHGLFSLSYQAIAEYSRRTGKEIDIYFPDRSDPVLVAVVEDLGERANGACARLVVVEIPDGVEYEIKEFDGLEHIAEKHRTWGEGART